MKTEIELDHKVLQKNLELTKALQTVDRLVSENINLNAKLDEYAEEITRLTIKLQDFDII
tara:strand:+ start:1111 stop:1290 length:180 start_codon:yes stop_codon:yes gene_type:complete